MFCLQFSAPVLEASSNSTVLCFLNTSSTLLLFKHCWKKVYDTFLIISSCCVAEPIILVSHTCNLVVFHFIEGKEGAVCD